MNLPKDLWKINYMLVLNLPGWFDYQSGKSLAKLAPVINWLLNKEDM